MDSKLVGPGDASGLSPNQAARYWAGTITRAEAQKVFDEQAALLTNLVGTVQRLDLVVNFLAEKAGFTPAQFKEWLDAKVAAAKAAQAPQETAPVN